MATHRTRRMWRPAAGAGRVDVAVQLTARLAGQGGVRVDEVRLVDAASAWSTSSRDRAIVALPAEYLDGGGLAGCARAAVAHEVGHYALGHFTARGRWGRVGPKVTALVLLVPAGAVTFAVTSSLAVRGLVAVATVAGVIGVVLLCDRPVRRQEYQVDAFAVGLVGVDDVLAQLRRLQSRQQAAGRWSRRLERRVAREPELRAMLERGAAAARSGELAARNRGVLVGRSQRSAQRTERQQMLLRTGRRGSQVNQAAAHERLVAGARTLGFADLGEYLRARHEAGWSVVRISAELVVARQTTARLLSELGLPGLLDAEHPVERAALRRVDAPDLATFLRAQHAAGVPVAVSARALGHSTPWRAGRARRDGLEELVAVGPTAEQRATAAARDAGFADAAGWLAHRCAQGETSRALQAHTGLHPRRLAELLRAGGITSPAAARQQRVLAQVGFDDLSGYASARAGWTVLRMSRELGVSDVWLARQLRAHDLGHLIGPKGRNSLARPGTRPQGEPG